MSDPTERTERPPRRSVIDVLLVGSEEAWGVFALPEDDDSDLFTEGGDPEVVAPLLLCRAVLDDGRLVIGQASPGEDMLLSEILPWDCCDDL